MSRSNQSTNPGWVQNLERELKKAIPVDLKDRLSHNITLALTDSVAAWGERQQCQVDTEFTAPWVHTTTKNGTAKGGFIDLVLRTPLGGKMAVEIDRGEKIWSLRKLILSREQGFEAIWIKWGKTITARKKDFADVLQEARSNGVHIIELPIVQPRRAKNRVGAIGSACPKCKAKPGVSCLSYSGQERIHFHQERRLV